MNSSRVIVEPAAVKATGDAPGEPSGEAAGLGLVSDIGEATLVAPGRVGMGAGVLVGSLLPLSPPHAANVNVSRSRTIKVDQRELDRMRNVIPSGERMTLSAR
ncbi:MAG: hypothetical protein M3Y37_09570 [Chloroflexota bacterium]|nr:hypothetical protein [Chloroflexota bacterium]